MGLQSGLNNPANWILIRIEQSSNTLIVTTLVCSLDVTNLCERACAKFALVRPVLVRLLEVLVDDRLLLVLHFGLAGLAFARLVRHAVHRLHVVLQT